jgi:tRNA A37 methylthiotransferase MiaB
VPAGVARERNQILREIAARKRADFMQAQVGTIVEAITLRTGNEDFTEALTDNYLKMKISGHRQANRWIAVKVQNVADGGQSLIGESIAPKDFASHPEGAPGEVTREPHQNWASSETTCDSG